MFQKQPLFTSLLTRDQKSILSAQLLSNITTKFYVEKNKGCKRKSIEKMAARGKNRTAVGSGISEKVIYGFYAGCIKIF